MVGCFPRRLERENLRDFRFAACFGNMVGTTAVGPAACGKTNSLSRVFPYILVSTELLIFVPTLPGPLSADVSIAYRV
jgi:hypothetical protein